VKARPFADEHDFCVRITHTKHHLRSSQLGQLTALAIVQ